MSAIKESTRLKLMTYNIGGRKDAGSSLDYVIQVIQKQEPQPDILVLQETVEWIDSEQNLHSTASDIAHALNMKEVGFGPALSMQESFHPNKAIFAHAIERGWKEWRQGNAILSRWSAVPLEGRSVACNLDNIRLFRPEQYEGNRDTEPRYALLTRIQAGAVSPFVIGTHLSTLVGERGGPKREEPGKSEVAQEMRARQVRHLVDSIKEHVLKPGELVFLMGDFNATVAEACIAQSLVAEVGFVRLIPKNDHTRTHRFKVSEPIDHIFVYPASRLVDYHCEILSTEVAKRASDHFPVVADVSVI